MEIVVRGRNRRVPKGLAATAREKLTRISRFTHDAHRVEVDFAEVRNPRAHDTQLCEVTVHLKRHLVKAHAAAQEPEAALDLVIAKVEHQAARIKDKRVSRSHPRRRRRELLVDGPLTDDPSADGARSNGPPLDDLDPDDDDDEGEARIVKVKQFAVKPMTPDEAALQMELLGHDFFLFRNSENGQAGVIYRRHDGDLGLIETE